MSIPFVPVITSKNVVNKSIVYSDTVLPLNEIGDNIKVNTLNNISEYSLDNCLNIIFKSNPDVLFNTIQYSKNDQKVYFYTDKELNFDSYKNSKSIKYTQINNKKEILEELKRVILLEDNVDSDCVSLLTAYSVIKQCYNYFNESIKYYERVLKDILSNKYTYPFVYIYDFDYKNKQLTISVRLYSFSDSDKLVFSKDHDGDLYLVSSETTLYKDELFNMLGPTLSKVYDLYLNNNLNDHSFRVNSVNSNFKLNLSNYGVSIVVPKSGYSLSDEFSLRLACISNDYDIECNSTFINEVVNGNESKIFNKIYVKIDDCPVWCRDELYNIRQKELNSEKKLSFVKRLFPFWNK